MMVEAAIIMEPIFLFIVTTIKSSTKLEAILIDYLRDFGPSMEKFKVVQNFHV